MPIDNLTFTHQLLKQHSVSSLEGYKVVVFESLEGAGEKYCFELEPGQSAPKRSWWQPEPNYFAYAVTTAPSLQAAFGAEIRMDDHIHTLTMTVHVLYEVGEPRLLAIRRNDDPLKLVREELVRLVAKQVAPYPWEDVENNFRQVEREVVDEVLRLIRPFAVSCGIRIQDLSFSHQIPRSQVPGPVAVWEHKLKLLAIQHAHEMEELQNKLKLARQELEAELGGHRRYATVLDSAAQALASALQHAGNSGNPAEIREALNSVKLMIQDIRKGQAKNGRESLAAGKIAGELEAGSQSGLAPVLCDVVTLTEEVDADLKPTRRLQAAMLHLVADLLLDEPDYDGTVKTNVGTIVNLTAEMKLSGSQSALLEKFVNPRLLRDRLQ